MIKNIEIFCCSKLLGKTFLKCEIQNSTKTSNFAETLGKMQCDLVVFMIPENFYYFENPFVEVQSFASENDRLRMFSEKFLRKGVSSQTLKFLIPVVYWNVSGENFQNWAQLWSHPELSQKFHPYHGTFQYSCYSKLLITENNCYYFNIFLITKCVFWGYI